MPETFTKTQSEPRGHPVPDRFADYPANGAWTPAQIADFDVWFATVPMGAVFRCDTTGISIHAERCAKAMGLRP